MPQQSGGGGLSFIYLFLRPLPITAHFYEALKEGHSSGMEQQAFIGLRIHFTYLA
jgi:hypothetical protein